SEDLSMEEFLNRKLNSEGDWYDERSFTSFKPGESYEYSNYGIALLALILESLEERSFDEISRSQILEPLGMSASYWKLDEVPDAVHVTYYNELLNEVPNYSIITYPDGGLYSSVSDMRLFIQELMKSYNGEGSLLTEASTRKMMKKQFEGEELYDGLCWDLSFEGLIGHSGNDFGTATLMYFSPKTGIGRILFTNISIETEDQEEAFYGIFNTLFGYDLSAY
ncbi:MAG: serine hydrolase domain-containing protein, partial [Bacteroidota bacterium]